jgi:hypothetical protein
MFLDAFKCVLEIKTRLLKRILKRFFLANNQNITFRIILDSSISRAQKVITHNTLCNTKMDIFILKHLNAIHYFAI